MSKISKRKLMGLIANEWFGIETCKVDDVISFIENIQGEDDGEVETLKQMLETKVSKIEPNLSEAIVFTFGDEILIGEVQKLYEVIKNQFPYNIVVGIPDNTMLKSLSKDDLQNYIGMLEGVLSLL